MAISAEQLNVILSARDREFTRAMDRAQRRVGRFERQSRRDLTATSRSFDQLGRAARTLGTLFAGVFTVNMLKNLTQSAAQIGRLSELSGTGAQELQLFAAGARTIGFEMDKVADIIKDVNDKVGDFLATGGGPMKDFFENIAPQVGVTADQFARLSGPQALQLYVSSLESANLSQAEMTFYMEALANDATALLPLLRENGKLMRELGEDAKETGRILDQDAIDGSRELENAVRDLSQAFNAELTNAFADNHHELISLINYVKENAIPAIGGFIDMIGSAVEKYRLLRGLEPLTGEGAVLGERERERQEQDITRQPGEGDPSQTGLFYVDENGDIKEYGVGTPPIPIITAPAVVPTAPAGTRSGGSRGVGSRGGGRSAVDQLSDLQEEYRDLIQTLSAVSPAQSEFNNAQDVLNRALQSGVISQQEYNDAMSVSKQRFEQAAFEASGLASVMDTVQSSMEDAFMSMIDGTASAKDAFKSMASSIIRELFRVLVVQRLVGGITAALGFPAAPSLPAGASGRSMQAGQPHIVGEHGRELFVPQTAGRVLSVAQAQNAVGGGGAVNVYQTINVSTGVQQTVRAEIKQLMPQIAESAKGAVVDAKRRGGSYGRAFA